MKITFFGTYNTKNTPRVQVLIDGLVANGVDVNECNVPLKVSTASRVKIAKQPWRLPLFGLQIISCWIRLVFKKFGVKSADNILVGYMGQFDVLFARRLYRKKTIILDYMISGAATVRDRKVGSSGGMKDKLLIWLDNAALKSSDIVIVDTEEHLQDIPKEHRHKGVVVLVGAPQSWFDAARNPSLPTDKSSEDPIKIMFFGLYTPLQSAVTIGQALALLKQPAQVTMIGTGQDYAITKAAAETSSESTQITWLDWVEASQLPAQVAAHDICLGIFGSEPKAVKVVPNKVYQGAAAGCALITSDTPPQRRVLKYCAKLIPTNDARTLAATIDNLASNPAELLDMRSKAYKYSREHFMPQKVVLPLIDRLK